MADSRALPGFGEVDLDFEDDPVASPSSSSPTSQTYDIDFEIEADSPRPMRNPFAEEAVPPSTSRVFNSAPVEPRRAPRKAAISSVHDESTRIVRGDALDALTRSSLPPAKSPLAEDGNTRAWAEVDDAVFSVGSELDDAPPSSRQPSGSSGVATRDNRVAAMRELYAKGDADGALALAAELSQSVPPPAIYDSPDASIVVEFGEQSIDIPDPFGGLVAVDEEPAPQVLGAAAALSLTERQSIPRMLKSLAEVSKLKMDHRAGFLLAHVDGMQTLEEILDVCAMPAAEALDVIAKLKEMAVIEFE